MTKKILSILLCALLLLLLLAGCGKAASMKNYRAYAVGIVNTYITDEDVRDDMLSIIKSWKKIDDFQNFQSLMALLSGGSLKTYDSWVTAGCPTPVPTASPTPKPADSGTKSTATSAPTNGTANTAAVGAAAATPAPAPAGGSQAAPGTQQGGTPPAGGSGEASGAPSGDAPPNG